jgi:hypothetical protein
MSQWRGILEICSPLTVALTADERGVRKRPRSAIIVIEGSILSIGPAFDFRSGSSRPNISSKSSRARIRMQSR